MAAPATPFVTAASRDSFDETVKRRPVLRVVASILDWVIERRQQPASPDLLPEWFRYPPS